MPLAFVFTPRPNPIAVNVAVPASSCAGDSPKHPSADFSGRKATSEHSKPSTPSQQNAKVLRPFKQGHPNKSVPLSQRFTEKLKEGSCWRQNRIGFFSLSVCSSNSTGWKRNWPVMAIPAHSLYSHLEWSVKITKTVTGDILKQLWNSRKPNTFAGCKNLHGLHKNTNLMSALRANPHFPSKWKIGQNQITQLQTDLWTSEFSTALRIRISKNGF